MDITNCVLFCGISCRRWARCSPSTPSSRRRSRPPCHLQISRFRHGSHGSHTEIPRLSRRDCLRTRCFRKRTLNAKVTPGMMRRASRSDFWAIKHRLTRKLDNDEIQYFDNGVTILHIAAYHADVETFNILKAARLTLDGNSLEDNGLSPRDYLHLRTVLDAKVKEAFDSLLASLSWIAPAESSS